MTHGQNTLRKKGFAVVKVNSKKGGGIKSIQGVIQEAVKKDGKRPKTRYLEPSGARHGCWNSERRKVYIYQLVGGEGVCKDWK